MSHLHTLFQAVTFPAVLLTVALAGCVPITQPSYDCDLANQSEQWRPFYPSEQDRQVYLDSIKQSDKNFEPGRITFWYKGKDNSVYACAFMFTPEKQSQFPAGCFTSQYLLQLDELGNYQVFKAREVVCT